MSSDLSGLPPGVPAPPFRLPDPTGQIYDLADYTRQGQKVALFFFRGTWCNGCLQMMAQLRRHAPLLAAEGWAILSIVSQRPETVAAYAQEAAIPFPILIDADRAVARLYRVYTLFRLDDVVPTVNNPQNSTFLIDGAGMIRFSYVNPRSNSGLSDSALLAALAAV